MLWVLDMVIAGYGIGVPAATAGGGYGAQGAPGAGGFGVGGGTRAGGCGAEGGPGAGGLWCGRRSWSPGVMVLEEVMELVAMARGQEARQKLKLLPVSSQGNQAND